MRPSSSIERRFSSRQTAARAAQPASPASLVTLLLLLVILLTGPLVLGAARLWIELPLLGLVAFLLLIQGFRLSAEPRIGETRQVDAIDLSVLIFVGYALVRWLTSPTEYFSRIEAMDIVAYAGVFFTCRYGLAQRKIGLALIFMLAGLGVFETGFGYYLHSHPDFFPFGPTEQLQFVYAPRWVGTYGCPNHYGGLLVMAIGAALALGCLSKLAWPARIVFIYLAAVIMIGVMYSISRGSALALIGSIIALMIFGLRHGTVSKWLPIVGALFIVLTAGALFSLSSDVRDRFWGAVKTVQTGTLNTYCRYELAQDALHIAHDHPLFGTGPATFVFIHPRYQDSTFTRKAVLTHDDYLNCLDDYGIIGFGVAMFFVAAVTLKFFQPLRAENRWQDRVMIGTAFAAWGALLIHSTVDFNLHIPANALMFFALIGLGLGRMNRDETGEHWSVISLVPLGRWLGWALVLFSLGYGFLVGKSAVGDILYEQAYAQALDIPTSESIQQVEEALRYDPGNAQALVFLGDLHRYRASRKDNLEDRASEGQLALEAYRRALQANPLDDTIEARMGMTFEAMMRYSEAFFCYKAAVTAQPYNGQFWYWLGNDYWDRGMTDKAQEAYERAAQCPHGNEGSEEAIQELHAVPGTQDLPSSDSGVNPGAQPEPTVNPLEPSASPPSEATETAPASEGTTQPSTNPEDHPPTMP
jgi:O-antigen ligase